MYSELDLKRAAKIIVRIARENNVSEEQVRADMKELWNQNKRSENE